jgi:hypothetical protein
LRVGGALAVASGSGDDALSIRTPNVIVAGQLSFKGGNGSNSATFAPVDATVGSLTIIGGNGADSFTIGDYSGTTTSLRVLGNVVTDVGTGSGSVYMRDLLVYGSLSHFSCSAQQSDYFALVESQVNGATHLKMTGAASGRVQIADSTLRNVTICTGDGNDLIEFDLNPTFIGPKNLFRGDVKIYLGAGDDVFNAGVNPAVAHRGNDFLARLVVDGGTGNDTANFVVGYGNTAAFGATIANVETVN